jgi:hypothetical protein
MSLSIAHRTATKQWGGKESCAAKWKSLLRAVDAVQAVDVASDAGG